MKWYKNIYRRQLTDMHIADDKSEYLSAFDAEKSAYTKSDDLSAIAHRFVQLSYDHCENARKNDGRKQRHKTTYKSV